jgi:SAM-dependent methyltransferase
MSEEQRYVLGSDPAEIARLDGQAASIEEPTRVLLRAAGLSPGQRVLDLGCGLGHVSFLAAELVGPDGSVTGLDADPAMLAVAEQRRREAGATNVRFVEGDVRNWRDADGVDAVIGRLILFHLPDAVDVLRHHVEALPPGGLAAVVDFDCGAVRTEPPVPLAERMAELLLAAFRSANADPVVGTKLSLILRAAGLVDVHSFGVQAYVPPGDPRGARLFAGVIRTLAPQMESAGIATVEELGLDTLEQRLEEAQVEAGAVVLLPTVVGAWGRRDAATAS